MTRFARSFVLSHATLVAIAVLSSRCGAPDPRCIPNEQRACACPGGRSGVQQCAASGASFSSCDCPSAADAMASDASIDAASAPPDSALIDSAVVDSAEVRVDVRVPIDSPSGLVECRSLPPSLPAGWRRGGPTQFSEVPWTAIAGTFWNPFPNSGGLGIIATSDGEYISIEFTTPTDVAEWNMRSPGKTVSWHPSQVAGEARLVYVGLSACPGDFRIPPSDSVAPTNDPTFARGCRSHRRLGTNANMPMAHLSYQIGEGPSDETVCRLAPGRRYYLNYIRADLSDNAIGAPAEEARCQLRTLSRCGVDMRVE
ncbi:MAG: hypothetical protein JNK05_19255 [Myxococcales bacterium]|nr:hypothetical protein [Myxococcales bacterium]